VTPYVLDFGYQYPGQGATKTLTVRNEGEAPFTLGAANLEQSEDEAYDILTSSFAIEGTVIAPGDDFPIDVSFTPIGSLPHLAQFSLATDDPQRPELRAVVRGNGPSALDCTAPSITMNSPASPFSLASGQGNHLQISATVSDAEQPPSGLLVELILGDTLVEEEFSGVGGAVTFDIDIDEFEVENVWTQFPQGINTFRLRVTDACPRSSELRFVAAIGTDLPSNDDDGDGFPAAAGDCDDNDASSYPGATELLDGVDNDCDGNIENGTEAWDNDCDGYCASPPCLGQGPAVQSGDSCWGLALDSDSLTDCDDRTADSNHDGISDGVERSPAWAEVPDYEDQNCNGIIDEGTNYADDDGDGLSELEGDCNDEDPSVAADAVELCDGADNNCEGTIDEDCIETLLAPRIVGDILTDRYEVPFGAAVEAQVVVLSDDPDLTWSWETDIGGITSETNQPTIVWEAPEATQANLELQGVFANLHVTVTDSQGRSTSAFGIIRIASDDDGPTYSSVGSQVCGCSALRSSVRPLPLSMLFVVLGIVGLSRRATAQKGLSGEE